MNVLTTWVVIDTSYLVELFRLPGHYSESSASEVMKRFKSGAVMG